MALPNRALYADVVRLINDHPKGAVVPWIAAWKTDVCGLAAEQLRLPAFCKMDDIIEYFIRQKKYDIIGINAAPFAFGKRLLGVWRTAV